MRIEIMSKLMKWVLAAILICGNMLLSSCSKENKPETQDNAYTGVPLVIFIWLATAIRDRGCGTPCVSFRPWRVMRSSPLANAAPSALRRRHTPSLRRRPQATCATSCQAMPSGLPWCWRKSGRWIKWNKIKPPWPPADNGSLWFYKRIMRTRFSWYHEGCRILKGCPACDALVLCQYSASHYYSDNDEYYTDYFSVGSREEAVELNEKYDILNKKVHNFIQYTCIIE